VRYLRGLAVVGVLLLAGCGDDGGDKAGGSDLSLVAGGCVNAEDKDDIKIVDCDDPAATAQVLGAYAEGRCPSGSFGMKREQILDGNKLPNLSGQTCAKDLDEITQTDLDVIDEVLNPKHFELAVIGSAAKFEDGPTPAVGGCLADGKEVSGSSGLVHAGVDCDDDSAKWKILTKVESSQPCDDEATAVARDRAQLLCLVEVG
jgi:hypothetical protein